MTGTTEDTSAAADIAAWQGLCCTMELATTCADDTTAVSRTIGGAEVAVTCDATLSTPRLFNDSFSLPYECVQKRPYPS